MSKVFFIFLLVFFTIFSCKDTDTDKERINAVCDKFMKTFSEGNFSNAIQSLKKNSVMTHSTIDTLDAKVQTQMHAALESYGYGNILGYEFINEGTVKNFIAKRYYILKFKKYYLKFDFTLYNSGNEWTITNFTFNDGLLEILR